MFQFAGSSFALYEFKREWQWFNHCRVSPFGHPRIKGWLPPPRGLSQAPTSFIVFWRQGIRHTPLLLQSLKHHIYSYVLVEDAITLTTDKLLRFWPRTEMAIYYC